ncbi:MAG: enoyl-CoA hydratase-related protein, partial [Bradyrhizobium sp.]|nr:enoyl-CoA hydratase-related protein [Bradyrhizobium sp.]
MIVVVMMVVMVMSGHTGKIRKIAVMSRPAGAAVVCELTAQAATSGAASVRARSCPPELTRDRPCCGGIEPGYKKSVKRHWKTAQRDGQGDAELAGFVTIEKGLGPEGRIAVVRFDRGDGINALSPEALRQLTDAARSFEDDGDTSVVVLTGGARAFTAGFDLKDPEGRARATMDLGTLRRHLKL